MEGEGLTDAPQHGATAGRSNEPYGTWDLGRYLSEISPEQVALYADTLDLAGDLTLDDLTAYLRALPCDEPVRASRKDTATRLLTSHASRIRLLARRSWLVHSPTDQDELDRDLAAACARFTVEWCALEPFGGYTGATARLVSVVTMLRFGIEVDARGNERFFEDAPGEAGWRECPLALNLLGRIRSWRRQSVRE